MPNHHTPIVPVDETTITKIQPQHPIDLDIAAWLKDHPGQWIDYPWQDRYPNTSFHLARRRIRAMIYQARGRKNGTYTPGPGRFQVLSDSATTKIYLSYHHE